ncbi:TIGR01244 family sulfur transferase [Salipiger bermudensis]|uniref:TIGR01244 family sulfur transferase n=1 Tax=Salipiger bermudensis TaxID=344736 RepID=UPI001CD4E3FB|nr:TIGR01244 family sulfur transferase [Salipiger bermudensis]MCA1288505.1 TIGR01244 family phosphatase [Salipiger bermudensis]
MAMIELTPGYSVSPQIALEDVQAAADAGITLVICNRPDAEVPPELSHRAMEEAARAAGMAFVYIPVTNESLTLEQVTQQAELLAEADGPVLAYCRSGTRCSIVWAMGKAGDMPVDEILATTAKAGYQLEGIRPTLETLAAQKG